MTSTEASGIRANMVEAVNEGRTSGSACDPGVPGPIRLQRKIHQPLRFGRHCAKTLIAWSVG